MQVCNKPVVFYDASRGARISVGQRALVWPINHPGQSVSNEECVITSMVLNHTVNSGEFETENTLYKPTQPCPIVDIKSLHKSLIQDNGFSV